MWRIAFSNSKMVFLVSKSWFAVYCVTSGDQHWARLVFLCVCVCVCVCVCMCALLSALLRAHTHIHTQGTHTLLQSYISVLHFCSSVCALLGVCVWLAWCVCVTCLVCVCDLLGVSNTKQGSFCFKKGMFRKVNSHKVWIKVMSHTSMRHVAHMHE